MDKKKEKKQRAAKIYTHKITQKYHNLMPVLDKVSQRSCPEGLKKKFTITTQVIIVDPYFLDGPIFFVGGQFQTFLTVKVSG